MANRKPLVPLNWDPEIVRQLSLIAPSDPEEAKAWWAEYAPVAYQALLDAPRVRIPEYINDEEELAQYLSGLDLDNGRQRALQALGILIFFSAGGYLTQLGRRIPRQSIVNTLDSVVRRRNMSNRLCSQLRDGSITLEQWQSQMAREIRLSHIAAGIIAAGGVSGLGPRVIRTIEDQIQFQLDYLSSFAEAIASGDVQGGNICRLMNMYLNSGRQSFHAVEHYVMAQDGFMEYRNVLGPAEDHCDGDNGCPAVSNRGWQPVGTLPEIGTRNCLSNCLCSWQYRRVVGIDSNGNTIYEVM